MRPDTTITTQDKKETQNNNDRLSPEQSPTALNFINPQKFIV